MIEHNEKLPIALCNFLSQETLSIFLFHGVIEEQIEPEELYKETY